jgi:hypothetical protein
MILAHIVKRLGYGEIPMYKEMHKITDIVKNGSLFFIRVSHRK